jgi:Putative prokaryotic signal transducing protein
MLVRARRRRAVRSTRTLGIMALVRVLSPRSEPELAVVRSLLEAHDIPVFVHGRHLGSLLPGLQIGNYNTQSIMVPEECVTDALELLTDFRRDNSAGTDPPLRWRDRLRVVLEGILGGWLVPGRHEGKRSRSREDHDA